MSLSLGARPWIYFGLGPFIGYICVIIFTMIHENLADFGNFTESSELLFGLPVFIFIAYVVGALPAFLTGLIMDFISRMPRNHFRNTKFRFLISSLLGFLLTISLLILFCFYTNEMDELYKTEPLSVLACSIYGAIAALVCERIHLMIGSPTKIE